MCFSLVGFCGVCTIGDCFGGVAFGAGVHGSAGGDGRLGVFLSDGFAERRFALLDGVFFSFMVLEFRGGNQVEVGIGSLDR